MFVSHRAPATHKETLADALTDEEWRILPRLFHNAESLRLDLLAREPGEPISGRHLKLIAENRDLLAAAY